MKASKNLNNLLAWVVDTLIAIIFTCIIALENWAEWTFKRIRNIFISSFYLNSIILLILFICNKEDFINRHREDQFLVSDILISFTFYLSFMFFYGLGEIDRQELRATTISTRALHIVACFFVTVSIWIYFGSDSSVVFLAPVFSSIPLVLREVYLAFNKPTTWDG